MLKLCPECCLQVSDKAATCPHCGYPLKSKSSLPPKKKKHMRLPNGFGQISEVRGRNLRKPFRAMVTAGRTDEGKPIVCPLRPVAYFETYNEAYEALMKYNAHPFDLSNKTTMQDLFDMWLTTKEKKWILLRFPVIKEHGPTPPRFITCLSATFISRTCRIVLKTEPSFTPEKLAMHKTIIKTQ